ncbi:MAG: hypothetical protein NWE89_07690 [Candidatus Bathyarchaeota archaeon]|nr:hypothetical protein [Candidatus Bathyarchaeota archaeon]
MSDMYLGTRRVMLFIDGGYLNRKLKDVKGDVIYVIEKLEDLRKKVPA